MRPLAAPFFIASIVGLSVIACSTPGTDTVVTAPTPTTSTTRVVSSGGGTLQMSTMNLDGDVSLVVAATPEKAWAVLPDVYKELGIPLSMNEPRSKTLGNTGWRTRRSIGKVPMQRYFDCGSSGGNMPNAETYQMLISIQTTVTANDKGAAVISTTLVANGKNPITSSSAEVRCASSGNLERRIRDMVQKAVYGQ